MKKLFVTFMVLGATVLVLGASSADAAKCGSKGGTKVKVGNMNTMFAGQSVFSMNSTGGNGSMGNIGGGVIRTGDATSTSDQRISGNTNTTTVDLRNSGGATNTTTVVNTGFNTTVCTSAAN